MLAAFVFNISMQKKDCFYFGIITKTRGLKGELVIRTDVDDTTRYKNLKELYLDFTNELRNYTVQKITIKDNQLVYVLLENVDVIEKAERLKGVEVFLPLNMLPALSGKKFYYHEVEGFAVVDEIKGEIGIIGSILNYPSQDLLLIKHGEKEILIPIVDEIIKSVDRNGKKLHIKAPEYLIDIYL